MDGLFIFLVILLGVAFCSQDQTSQSVLEVTVTPGDNITLYCDCKSSTGVYIVWYRNCSHEHQSTLVLQTISFIKETDPLKSKFQFLSNSSSKSFDLLIMNITDSDEGLYYCGTEEMKMDKGEYITQRKIYSYGNVTMRIKCDTSKPHHRETIQVCDLCWMLVYSFSTCPAFAVLCSLLYSLQIYHLSKEPQVDERRSAIRGHTTGNQDEDMCMTQVIFWAQNGQTHQ
ncbi:uncharacterized protein LOC121180035 isoform X2 [Toxotes jaculatrix]|uniref:uncharacterized protein LOC121180035 isoform X2 n=1 Tax=Toxotes jaculatrix TaxID=941984 RepID=UPI001B3A98B5|nr:uncharacterized protein LOC121180035 isoform X2 [Toxotes jaculatrix]